MTTKKTSLLNMVQTKRSTLAAVEPTQKAEGADATANSAAVSASDEAERHRVVVRLNVEAVEAIEDIARELRRETGRAVPMQRLMEEAVADLLRKYGRSAVVLPAPAKRGR